jgi:hypothetical protein
MAALAFLEEPEVESISPDTYREFASPIAASPVLLLVEATFRGQPLRLRVPVEVRVSPTSENWLAECERLNLLGVGQTATEAFYDLRDHFEHYLDYYHSLEWDRVAGEGRELKQLYEGLIR